MNVILLGKPGCGKGTQAKKLAERFGLTHLCTGDEFRKTMKEGGRLASFIKPFMMAGELVPDEETCGVVHEFLKSHAGQSIVWDGFPRNYLQADWLEHEGVEPDLVIVIDLPDQAVIDRLTNRRVCQQCGRIYSLNYQPPQNPDRCDACDGALFQRDDDKEEIIRGRLEEYCRETELLVNEYRQRGRLYLVPGEMGSDRLFKVLCFLIEQGRVKE